MTSIYINVDNVVFVEETDVGVVITTTVDDIFVTESIGEVMTALDDGDSKFVCLTRFDPVPMPGDEEPFFSPDN